MNSVNETVLFIIMKRYLTISIYLKGKIFQSNSVFFDTVCHSKLIEVLSRTIRGGRVISLIHKYLNAGVNNYLPPTRLIGNSYYIKISPRDAKLSAGKLALRHYSRAKCV